jgi:hypothetical protein
VRHLECSAWEGLLLAPKVGDKRRRTVGLALLGME